MAPDEAIELALQEFELPAVSVAVIEEGNVTYSRASGVRKRGETMRVGESDPFHIGSNTKAMTAVLAATLVDHGKLHWDDTIGEILGGTVTFLRDYKDVTLMQLLSHSSGIGSELADWSTFVDSTAPLRAERRRMAEDVLSAKPVEPPGTSFLYSNFNYVVAGLMLEVTTGHSWETLMRERLFEPLGMSSAGFGSPATEENPYAPWGHDPEPNARDNPEALGPAGTVHVNTADLAKYVGIYLDGPGALPGAPILSAAALFQIERPVLENYALGWGLSRNAEGDTTLTHYGTNGAFYSGIRITPSHRSAVIVLTNQGGGDTLEAIERLQAYLEVHFEL